MFFGISDRVSVSPHIFQPRIIFPSPIYPMKPQHNPKVQSAKQKKQIRLLSTATLSCAFRSLFASPSRQSKPMNFVPDGVHRMFQLTQHGPPELLRNSRRMRSILQARTWDMQSIFGIGMRGQVMLPGQGGPSGEGHLRPEMVSLPCASRAQRDITIWKPVGFPTLKAQPLFLNPSGRRRGALRYPLCPSSGR